MLSGRRHQRLLSDPGSGGVRRGTCDRRLRRRPPPRYAGGSTGIPALSMHGAGHMVPGGFNHSRWNRREAFARAPAM